MITFDDLVHEIKTASTGNSRLLVGIAGPPGSGKSTLAENLANQIGAPAAVLPMDGFHFDNATLRQKGLFERKGAAETFDAESFIELVRAIRHQPSLTYPTFDREADRTINDGGRVEAGSKIVIVEGNYLLLDTPPWTKLSALFDLTVKIDVPRSELERRLIERWLKYGLSASAAKVRAQGNDMRNADLVLSSSRASTFVYRPN